MVVLDIFNNFHKSLKERQSLCLNKVPWGQPVLPGKHASFTIDRKHRGTPNPYDIDPNASQTDDETGIGETQPTETTACASEDSNAVVPLNLDENDPKQKLSAVSNETDVAVITDKPLNPPSSDLESVLHSNEDGNIKKWKNKKLKLSNKLSNKENHKKHGKLRCLQRRSLFRKSRIEASSAIPSIPEIPEVDAKQIQTVSLSDTSPKEMLTILPDPNISSVKCPEDIVIPCDDLPSCAAVSSVFEESRFNNKSSPPPRTSNFGNESSSPLRESNLSTSCEIRSSSPVFSAYESPFRNSNIVSSLKDYSMTKVEESSVSVESSVTNAEETNEDLPPSSSSKPQLRLLESDYQDSVIDDKIKRKTRIGKKIQKPKAMVQCPLCCDWFKPKAIEVHAANCGIMTAAPVQHDAMAPELKISSDAGLTDTLQDPKTITCQTEPSPVVLESVNESVMPLENETTCDPVENQVEDSDFVPVQKHCFICDLSYVDGKPFSNHLRMCRKKYQKLKRQFSGFSEECEEPKRKTRHSSF